MAATRENIEQYPELQRLAKQIKILEIERNLAGRRGFWKGLLTGLAVIVLLIGGIGLIAWQNPAGTLEFVAENFLLGYMESLFAGFPDAYMTNNRERVIQTLDEFTNAMQYQRVSQEDFREIARQIFAMLQDRRLTYQELDGLLESLHKAAQMTE
ncbi:MAG: hypothetical protein ACREOI_36690 [bacterium]